jgi:hypothetical protein
MSANLERGAVAASGDVEDLMQKFETGAASATAASATAASAASATASATAASAASAAGGNRDIADLMRTLGGFDNDDDDQYDTGYGMYDIYGQRFDGRGFGNQGFGGQGFGGQGFGGQGIGGQKFGGPDFESQGSAAATSGEILQGIDDLTDTCDGLFGTVQALTVRIRDLTSEVASMHSLLRQVAGDLAAMRGAAKEPTGE